MAVVVHERAAVAHDLALEAHRRSRRAQPDRAPHNFRAGEPPHTTSDVSGAFWAPFGLVDDGRLTTEISDRVVKAARLAYAEFEKLKSDPRYAIRQVPIYYIDDQAPSPGIEMTLLPDLFSGPILGPGEHPWGKREVMVVQGMCFDPTPFLEAVREDFLRDGGTIVRREFGSREEIAALPESVVFNCTGLGSRELANDDTLIPMKGQLNLFEAQPEIDYMIALERERIYMMPRRDCIVVGTSKIRNDWTLTPDPAETARVVAGIRRLYEGLCASPTSRSTRPTGPRSSPRFIPANREPRRGAR